MVGRDPAEATNAVADGAQDAAAAATAAAGDAAEDVEVRREAALLLRQILANEDAIKIITNFPPPR